MVPSKFSGSKAARCLPVLLAALFFAGCGTQTADQSTAHMQGEAKADSGFYLHQMEQSRDDSKTNWQLLAIRALLSEGKRERAMTLYGELPQNLTDAQRREASL
ncbi:penicillin-binding protein activator, partial [Cronobacter sakazakii]